MNELIKRLRAQAKLTRYYCPHEKMKTLEENAADAIEKLVELIGSTEYGNGSLIGKNFQKGFIEKIASHLIANGVTVQEHGYWETVVEVRDNTVCGSGVKIEYKRCSCCKNPAKNFEDDFCGSCGAKLGLPQPPKGE